LRNLANNDGPPEIGLPDFGRFKCVSRVHPTCVVKPAGDTCAPRSLRRGHPDTAIAPVLIVVYQASSPAAARTQAPVAQRPVALPSCSSCGARHGSISQRPPRVRAGVFALGWRDQVGPAPPSLAGNGQDLGSGGTGARTQRDRGGNTPPQLQIQAAKIRPATVGGVGVHGANESERVASPHAEEPYLFS